MMAALNKDEQFKRREQSERDKGEAHIRIVNNGYLIKTSAGWFVCKTEPELHGKLSDYLKLIKERDSCARTAKLDKPAS